MISGDMAIIIFVLGFAVLNRARGTHLFGLTDSTVLGRVISALGMATIVTVTMGQIEVFPVAFAGLMIWMTPAWDAYWSAEIGNDSNHSKGWGIANMAWRMALAAPAIIGVAFITGHPSGAWWTLGTLLLWLPYYAIGSVSKPHVIPFSEYIVGAALGFLIAMAGGLCG